MSVWEKRVEKEIISIGYLLSMSKLAEWGVKYEEHMDSAEWGDKLYTELELIGCENMHFEDNGDFTFTLMPINDNTLTWENIEAIFNKYAGMLNTKCKVIPLKLSWDL